jgi:hypothetical protein
MAGMLDQECSKCGETLKRAFLLAMLLDAGARSNLDPLRCPRGGEHDWFVPPPPTTTEPTKEGDAP